MCLTSKCSGEREGGNACPSRFSFPVCVSGETRISLALLPRGAPLASPRRAGSPGSVGLRSGVDKPLCSVVSLKPRVPCSAKPGTEAEEKEPWIKVKRRCWRCPWLCRADVKFPASLATWETPRVLQMWYAGCWRQKPLALA